LAGRATATAHGHGGAGHGEGSTGALDFGGGRYRELAGQFRFTALRAFGLIFGVSDQGFEVVVAVLAAVLINRHERRDP